MTRIDDAARRAHRRLERVRRRPRVRGAATAAGVISGLAIALVHWLGFLVAGVTIGLFAPSLRQALGVGLGVGVVSVGFFLGGLWLDGFLDPALAMGRLAAVAGTVPIALILTGAAIRSIG